MLPQYTFKPFAPWKLDYVNHVIRHDLNKNMGIPTNAIPVRPRLTLCLAKIFPSISEEVEIALSLEFPNTTGKRDIPPCRF